MCIAVTVDMALACAARSGTLQDVLMHGEDYRHTAGQTQVSAVSFVSSSNNSTNMSWKSTSDNNSWCFFIYEDEELKVQLVFEV